MGALRGVSCLRVSDANRKGFHPSDQRMPNDHETATVDVADMPNLHLVQSILQRRGSLSLRCYQRNTSI